MNKAKKKLKILRKKRKKKKIRDKKIRENNIEEKILNLQRESSEDTDKKNESKSYSESDFINGDNDSDHHERKHTNGKKQYKK